MDEKARKFFHKEYAELSDYERMMLDIMGDGEEADSAEEIAPETPEEVEAPAAELPPEEPEAAPETPEEPDTSEVTLLPVSEETEELPAAFPAEDAPLEAHTQRPESAPVEELQPVPEAEAAPAEAPRVPASPAVESEPAQSADETDDSDVKIAGDGPIEPRAERIPLLVEEKNPELEPVVVSRPTIQFMNSIEREKKITRKVRAQRRRSRIVVAALCVALILVAFMYNGLVNKSWGILEKTEPTPEPVEEVLPPEVHETPEPTPELTPEPVIEHRYVIERADVSWAVAQDRCLASGGYLAVINSLDELNTITALADQQGVEFLWLGARRDVTRNTFVWEKDEPIDDAVDPNNRQLQLWAAGEPSFIDDNGTAENYLILWNHDGGWSYWDSVDDLAGPYPGWRGRIAYVCELENVQ